MIRGMRFFFVADNGSVYDRLSFLNSVDQLCEPRIIFYKCHPCEFCIKRKRQILDLPNNNKKMKKQSVDIIRKAQAL